MDKESDEACCREGGIGSQATRCSHFTWFGVTMKFEHSFFGVEGNVWREWRGREGGLYGEIALQVGTIHVRMASVGSGNE